LVVRGDFLRVLERAAIGEVGGDPGGPEVVAADFCRDAGRRRAPGAVRRAIPRGAPPRAGALIA